MTFKYKITEHKEEVSYWQTFAKCGKVLRAHSEPRLRHNIKLHESFCKEGCK